MRSPGALTDGWWACSIIERLSGFVRDDVFDDVVVGGYLAPKSRLASSPTQVPSKGFAIDEEQKFVALTPSKWSTAPTSAVMAVQALLQSQAVAPPVPTTQHLLERMSELIGAQTPDAAELFEETWQTLSTWIPFSDFTTPGPATLETAASAFHPVTAAAGSVFAK